MDTETMMRSAKCLECGLVMEIPIVERDEHGINNLNVLCDDCVKEYEARRARADRVQLYKTLVNMGRVSRETTLCSFAKSDKNIELTNQLAWEFCKNWEVRKGNIYLHGPNGTGKSYVARCLLNRTFGNGRSVEEINARRFTKVCRLFDEGCGDFKRWCSVPFLLFDDIDKGEWDGRTINALWELLEHRHSNRVSTVVTSNMTTKGLTQYLTAMSQGNSSAVHSALDRLKPITIFEMKPTGGKSLRCNH